MADRVLRGSRMGAVSYETDRDHDLAPRQMVKYRTEDGEIYEVPFADDAEIPEEWLCKNGKWGTLYESGDVVRMPVKPTGTCCVNAAASKNSTNCSKNASSTCVSVAVPQRNC